MTLVLGKNKRGVIIMGEQSILNTIKKMLGIDSDYTDFDTDIIVGINSSFAILSQLGLDMTIGNNDLTISDSSAVWDDYLNNYENVNDVISYVYLRVRLMFDPPSNSFLVKSIEDQIKELEWRINVAVDTE